VPNGFPPQPVFPFGIDSDQTLFLVYNTTESRLASDNQAWAEEIDIVPVASGKDEIWPENGFATLEGEILYYDAVEKDDNDKINKLKRCVRNLGGKHTKFNLAGTDIRAFVMAEHHNQIADTILRIEDFVGENFTPTQVTLDWRIRNLQALPVIFDDFTCPDITFQIDTISSDATSGTIVQYNVIINGNFSAFRLDFGDGTFTDSVLTGTHQYAPSATIDPVITVSNTKCVVVQSPPERLTPTEPPAQTALDDFFVPIPECPDFPALVLPEVVVPSVEINFPPIVLPCLDLSPIGPINIPSIIIVDPPINIPSEITITPIEIPSEITITPIEIPSEITITPISIPTLITITPPTIPTLITFTPPTIPTLITFTPPEIPTVITFADPPVLPTLITFADPPTIPTVITFEPPTIPTVIVFVDPPIIPTVITFDPPTIPTLITFVPPTIPTVITFVPPTIPTVITFVPPTIPTVITFIPPEIPTVITFIPPTIPTVITFIPPTIPTVITFIPPTIPTVISFIPPDIPTLITLVGSIGSIITVVHDIPTIIELIGSIGSIITVVHDIPTIITVEDTVPTIVTVYDDVPSVITVYDDIPTIIEVIAAFATTLTIVGTVPTIIWIDASDVPTAIQIDWRGTPTVVVDWGTPPVISCVVTVSCPAPSFAMTNTMSGDFQDGFHTQFADVGAADLGIPSEIKIVAPDIRVIHDLPMFIDVRGLDIPSLITLQTLTPIPQEINIVHTIPNVIELRATDIPTTIFLKNMDVPEFIELRLAEDVAKKLQIELTGVPESIQLVGAPTTIDLVGDIPTFIQLVMPDKPQVEMVYKGSPIDVRVQLEMNKLLGAGEDAQCVAIVPCPRR